MINTRRPAPVHTSTLPKLIDTAADVRSLASIVATDAGLACRVLGLANSEQFGVPRTVGDLEIAVGLVGPDMVQTLAIASAATLLDQRGAGPSTRDHALRTACAARRLAVGAGVRPTDAFAAGLLHDIGELLLLQAEPTRYAALQARFTSHHAQLRAEKEAFGADHALVGAEHLLDWRVPDVIADAVADHHDPFETSAPTTLVVAAADELVSGDPSRRHALDLLGVDRCEEERLVAAARDEQAELVALLAA